MRQIVLALTTLFALAAIASTTHAQGMTFSPSKGQSAEQATKDTTECKTGAVQQSGFDPAKAQAAAAQPQQAAGGERVRGAAKGAAVGAAAGAIAGDASKGAAAGAAAGTVGGGMKKRQAAREQTAQAQQQTAASQGQGAYDKSLIACMLGRGYMLK